MTKAIEAVHEFWFGPLNDAGLCSEAQNKLWFSKSDKTDRICRGRFSDSVEQAIAGELGHWADNDRGLIALVVLLDQLTRNLYRDTPQAFAGDSRALQLAQQAIASGRHLRLPAIHRVFLYLPLEHREDLAIQEQCLTLFELLRTSAGSKPIEGYQRYAIAHRDVIKAFGRFPHRNRILGRASSPQELKYLAEHGGF
jgi:uncharacterized protein (DUF924 family)